MTIIFLIIRINNNLLVMLIEPKYAYSSIKLIFLTQHNLFFKNYNSIKKTWICGEIK